ncbi:MAG: T9SS type A sorting domain-containing protein [Saprospiraceae bacterium]|nr:T9SS type A sorting domain-containing protein [Saprospiraceae bacterium]
MSKFYFIFLCNLFGLALLATKGNTQQEVSFLGNIFEILNSDSLHQDKPVTFYRAINSLNHIQQSRVNKLHTDYIYVLDSTVRFDYDFNTPIKVGKGHILYDTINQRELSLNFDPTSTPNVLIGKSYTVRHYNDKEFFIRQSFNPWDGDYKNLDESNPLTIQTFYYDNNGLLERSESQGRQEIEENRPSSVRLLYYNDNQLLERYEYYSWDNTLDSLTLRDYTLYRHNDQKLLDNIVQWDLHPVRGWEYLDSTSFTYNEVGQLVKEDNFFWSISKGNIFFPNFQRNYLYNTNGTLKSRKRFESYKENTNTWGVFQMGEFDYHEYGSLSTITSIDSVYPYMIPEEYYEIKYIHDENIHQENVQLPRSLDQGFHEYQNHILLTREENSIRYGSSPVERVEYYYSKLPTTSTQEVIKQDVASIYPNPVISNNINVFVSDYSSVLDVTIYNIDGQRLRQKQIQNNAQLNIAHLEPGIYIMRISAGEKYYNGKFVRM